MTRHWFRSPKALVLIPLSLVLLVAVACGAAAPDTPVPVDTQAKDTTPPAAKTDTNDVPVAKVEPTAIPQVLGGKPKVHRLVVTGTVPAFETTDPYAMSPSSLPPIHPMFENLLQFDRNTLDYTPMLAESWDVAPDFMSVTFQLRENVLWHKGFGEFTADDVVATYRVMVSDHSITTYVAQWKNFMDPSVPEANFEILSPHEIKFNWAQPQLDFELFVSRIIDFTIINGDHYDSEGNNYRDNPIGTGPYQLLEHRLAEGFIYERVPYEHYRITPDFPELEYRFTPEPTTRLAQLLANEAHIAQLLPEQRVAAEKRGMVTVSTAVPSNTMAIKLFFNRPVIALLLPGQCWWHRWPRADTPPGN